MSKKEELISIITVNWNGKKWLRKYLNSVQKQTYKKIEVIVVDNASTDGSVEFINRFFPKVKIIKNNKNLGLAKATNIGVKESEGKYILFINNDTWFDKDFIAKLYSFYSQGDNMVVSASEKRYFDDKSFICNTTIDITGSPAYYVPAYSRPNKIFYLTVCFFCSKSDFIKTGGLDGDFYMYYEDVDWFWRLSLFGKKFTVVKDCFIHHAGAGSTGEGIKYNFFLWRNQNTLQALLKNYSLKFLVFLIPLYIAQNLFEMIFFLIIGKPKISFSYLQGWFFNITNLMKTLNKRRWIQNRRAVGDFEIIKKMYPFPSKFVHLANFIGAKI